MINGEDIKNKLPDRLNNDVYLSGAEYGVELLDEIRNELDQEKNNTILSLEETSNSFGSKIQNFFVSFFKISVREKSYFYHMLFVMLDAGIPIVQALNTVSSRTSNSRFKSVLSAIVLGASKGVPMADLMSRFYYVFEES